MEAAPVIRDDVVLTPAQPKQAMAFEPEPMSQPVAEAALPHAAPFIPPQADRPVRAPRMPEIHDLPPHVHGQVRASRGEAEAAPAASAPEQKRMTLLQRLATVGFGGGRKEEAAPAPLPAEAPPLPMPAPAAPAPVAATPEPAPRPAPSPAHAEYAKRPAAQGYRPAQGSLDQHGRAVPPQRSIEEEQLEIPAFLRRQAN